MRLLLVIPSLEIGGAERQAIALARHLAPRHSVHLATFYPGGPLAAETRGTGVQLHDLGKRSRWDLSVLWRLPSLVAKVDADVVYAWLPQTNILSSWIRLLRPRVRIAWSVLDAGALPSELGAVSRAVLTLEPSFSRIADVIITNSVAGQARSVDRGFQVDKLRLVSNGIDVDRFSPRPSARERVRREWGAQDEIVIGIVARLDPIKDHRSFLRAAALVAEQRSDVRFVAIGGGPAAYRAELEQLAADLGIRDRVTFAGARSDVPDVLSSFDIGTLTSLAEGFPNAVGESMAAGLPCVVTNVGDCARLVGETGLVVPAGDPLAIATAWLAICAMPVDQRLSLGRAARDRVRSVFGVETMAHETEKVLEEVLTRS